MARFVQGSEVHPHSHRKITGCTERTVRLPPSFPKSGTVPAGEASRATRIPTDGLALPHEKLFCESHGFKTDKAQL